MIASRIYSSNYNIATYWKTSQTIKYAKVHLVSMGILMFPLLKKKKKKNNHEKCSPPYFKLYPKKLIYKNVPNMV